MSDDTQRPENETALEEVMREIEEAELRSDDSPEARHHHGESADAITPNADAQNRSKGD